MSDSRHQEPVLSRAAVTAVTQGATDEVAELLRTMEQENVRRLSVTLLIDLLALEPDRSHAAELVCDATVLGEDLLLAGDYDGAGEVIRALARHAEDSRSAASEAARVALEGLAATVAFREAADCLGEMDHRAMDMFARLPRRIAPSCVGALLRASSRVRSRRAS